MRICFGHLYSAYCEVCVFVRKTYIIPYFFDKVLMQMLCHWNIYFTVLGISPFLQIFLKTLPRLYLSVVEQCLPGPWYPDSHDDAHFNNIKIYTDSK